MPCAGGNKSFKFVYYLFKYMIMTAVLVCGGGNKLQYFRIWKVNIIAVNSLENFKNCY